MQQSWIHLLEQGASGVHRVEGNRQHEYMKNDVFIWVRRERILLERVAPHAGSFAEPPVSGTILLFSWSSQRSPPERASRHATPQISPEPGARPRSSRLRQIQDQRSGTGCYSVEVKRTSKESDLLFLRLTASMPVLVIFLGDGKEAAEI
jgi:hypothetical protein